MYKRGHFYGNWENCDNYWNNEDNSNNEVNVIYSDEDIPKIRCLNLIKDEKEDEKEDEKNDKKDKKDKKLNISEIIIKNQINYYAKYAERRKCD